jgi:hypothetical protein
MTTNIPFHYFKTSPEIVRLAVMTVAKMKKLARAEMEAKLFGVIWAAVL